MTLEVSANPTANIDDTTIEALRANLSGALLRSGEDGYDEARTIFNGMIDRHPALIARCAGTGDVAKAVRFAREKCHPLPRLRSHYERWKIRRQRRQRQLVHQTVALIIPSPCRRLTQADNCQ